MIKINWYRCDLLKASKLENMVPTLSLFMTTTEELSGMNWRQRISRDYEVFVAERSGPLELHSI